MEYKAIDLHCDSVFHLVDGKDLRQRQEGIHIDLPRMREGKVGLQVFAVYVPPDMGSASFGGLGTFDLGGDTPYDFTNKRLDAIQSFASSDDLLALVETAAELRAGMAADKTGIMLAIENSLAIEGSLEKLEKFRRRKVRMMTLVHSKHLPWVASCTGDGPFNADGPNQTGRGLSDFGEHLVDAMNDLGIIPDLSHASESAFWDVLKRSKKPVVASHSCAYSICASPRNLKDDQLKALGDSGGLVGINFFSGFLSEPFRQAFQPLMNDASLKLNIAVKVPFSIIADHIDYMVKFAGEDSVGLGSDFDGIPEAPEGVTGSDFYPILEAELRSRGYTEKQIEKIFNANFIRVLEEWD